MTIAIVASRADRASEHIGERLLDILEWTELVDDTRPDGQGGGTYYRNSPFELRWFDDLHIELHDPAAAFGDPRESPRDDPEEDGSSILVFISRHSGDSGPLLTGHFTGNFGEAEFGGEDHELAPAAPSALSVLIEAMAAHAPEGYEVGIEATHHGPTDLSRPALFAEVGSQEAQWEDPAAARAVARGVLALRGVPPHRKHQLVGVGGGHYAPRFERVLRETPWAVGHVACDWQLEALGDPNTEVGRDVIEQAFERSQARHAIIDGDHPAVAAVVEALGYRVVSETWVREVGDRSPDLVETLEDRLCPVDGGLRMGDRHPDQVGGEAVEVISLPDDLLTEAQGIDAAATREAVEAATVAFETVEGGARARGSAAVVAKEARVDLVEALAAILAETYDEVVVEPDAVVARETAFDPEKAAALGVAEGPKFGRLAEGEPVAVDGREIPPSAVRKERTVEFPR